MSDQNLGANTRNPPRVTVIIPTYNRSSLLPEAIDSVFQQTFQDFELIVVDDGSTDRTAQVVALYDSRLSYVYQDNRGRSAARNLGIRMASAEYVVFLDSDDMFAPRKLQTQVQYLDTHPEIAVVYGDGEALDEQGLLSPEPMLRRYDADSGIRLIGAILRDNLFPIHAAMVRRSALLSVPLFDEQLSCFEDWDLWLRLALAGHKITYRPDQTAIYRRHRGNSDLRSMTAFRLGFAAIVQKILLEDLDHALPQRMRQEYRTGASQLSAVLISGSPRLAARSLRTVLLPNTGPSLLGVFLLVHGLVALSVTAARVIGQRWLPGAKARHGD